jgi:DNA phosphorothioation-associated putative methyltransferase
MNENRITVERHRTAIRRTALSRPIQLAQECGILTHQETIFDYGCGHGDDVRLLTEGGFSATGWDPLNFDTGAKLSASIVNLGYVLNVIEEPDERRDALLSAWELAQDALGDTQNRPMRDS